MQWLIYPLVAFVALVLLMQYRVQSRAHLSVGRPAPDTSVVDGEARADPRRVYYFYALHCGPCRAMTPMVDRLRETHRNLIKVNVADAPALVRDFGVAATPSFVQVEDGAIRQVKIGGLGEKQLMSLLAEA